MKVTQEQLIDIIRKNDSDDITVLYEVPVKMNKTGNPFYTKEGRSFTQLKSVTKRVINTFGFGLNYADEINKELRRNDMEGDYKAKEVAWAETVIPDKVIRHKVTGKYYLKLFNVYIPNVPERSVSFFVDGEPASDEEMEIISQFEIKTDGNVKRQEDAGLSNENQVKMQTVAFDNLIAVVLDDVMYELM